MGKFRIEDQKFKNALKKVKTQEFEPSLDSAHVCYENSQKGKKGGKRTKSMISETINLTDLLQEFTSLADDAVQRRSTSEGREEELLQWMNDTITTHSYFQGYNTKKYIYINILKQ